jgi:hypothetical protein
MSLTVSADPAGRAMASAITATITITGVDQEGSPLTPITIPVSLAMGNRWIGSEPVIPPQFDIFLPMIKR